MSKESKWISRDIAIPIDGNKYWFSAEGIIKRGLYCSKTDDFGDIDSEFIYNYKYFTPYNPNEPKPEPPKN